MEFGCREIVEIPNHKMVGGKLAACGEEVILDGYRAVNAYKYNYRLRLRYVSQRMSISWRKETNSRQEVNMRGSWNGRKTRIVNTAQRKLFNLIIKS